MEIKKNLNEIKRGKPKYKSEHQKNVIEYVICICTKEAISWFIDYTTIIYKTKYEAKHGKGLKILNPKQMLQILPITLAQTKEGSTSENLLNETRHIIFSFY